MQGRHSGPYQGPDARMFDPTDLLARQFGSHLGELYAHHFGHHRPQYGPVIAAGARLLIERLALGDALYHDARHTVMVTLVGQEILRGRLLCEPIAAEDWLHFTVACLCHDVGYVRGVCRGDRGSSCVTDAEGGRVELARGATDAALTAWHVDRSQIFVRERFGDSPVLDAERLAAAIEYTRFPVPDGPLRTDCTSEAAMVRAADLIGQIADPLYPQRMVGLFHEFAETGAAGEMGIANPDDLRDLYPRFYWDHVNPYIGRAVEYLEMTTEGKSWVASLYSHVFRAEQRP